MTAAQSRTAENMYWRRWCEEGAGWGGEGRREGEREGKGERRGGDGRGFSSFSGQ